METNEKQRSKKAVHYSKKSEALQSLSVTRSLIWGTLITAVFLVIVYFLGEIKSFASIRAMFFERGFIQYLITYLGAWSFAIAFLKQKDINWEEKKNLEIQRNFTWSVKESVDEALTQLKENVRMAEGTRLFHRIQRAFSAFKAGMESNDLREVLLEQSERDSENVELSYTILKVLVAVIPLLGFTGTVLGISNAVNNFSTVIESAKELEQVTQHLGGVTTGLAVAFDTTLLSLLITVPLMMYVSALKKREDEMLLEIDEFCEYEILDQIFQSKSKEKHFEELIAQLDPKILEDHLKALNQSIELLGALNANVQKQQVAFTHSVQKYEEISRALSEINKSQEFWADQIMSLEKVNGHLETIFHTIQKLPEALRSALVQAEESYYKNLIAEMEKIIAAFEAKDTRTSEKLDAFLVQDEEVKKAIANTLEGIKTNLTELKPLLEKLGKPVTITLSHHTPLNE